MQDLNQIAAANTRATQDAIPAEQARGKYVVAKYTGVNFMGYTTHDALHLAEDEKLEHETQAPGFKAVIHAPVRPRTIHQSPLPANMTP